MVDANAFFMQQELNKALSQIQSEKGRLAQMSDVHQIARSAQSELGQAWCRQGNPDYRRAQNQLILAAQDRIKALYTRDPSKEMTERCWQASRGWSVREADFYYQEYQKMNTSAALPNP